MEHEWASSPAPVSKQFEPKKYKDSVQRLKQESSPVFTPFKTSTLSRSTTPSIETSNSRRSATLRPARPSPFVYDPPASQSTPKAVRPGSAMQMGREQKLTWGRLPTNLRCASAAGHMTLRPPSRQSEMNGVSRFQSYSTLPRPEQLDPEHLIDGHVVPYFPKIVSRPPSAVPGMASDYVRPPSAFAAPILAQPPPIAPILPPSAKYIANWGILGTICGMQILIALFIFGFGILRTIMGAKWAVGVELLYASSAVIAGLSGVIAAVRHSYAYALFTYGLSLLNILFSIPPFLLGLFPLIPYVLPELESDLFLARSEPTPYDLTLSFLLFLQQLLNIVIVINGCRTMGKFCHIAEDFKFRTETDAAFAENSPIPQKV